MERGTVVVDRPWVRYAYYKTLVLPKLSKEPTQTRMKPFLRIRSEISRKRPRPTMVYMVWGLVLGFGFTKLSRGCVTSFKEPSWPLMEA